MLLRCERCCSFRAVCLGFRLTGIDDWVTSQADNQKLKGERWLARAISGTALPALYSCYARICTQTLKRSSMIPSGTRVSCLYKRGYDAPGAARRGMHMEVQLFSGHDARKQTLPALVPCSIRKQATSEGILNAARWTRRKSGLERPASQPLLAESSSRFRRDNEHGGCGLDVWYVP